MSVGRSFQRLAVAAAAAGALCLVAGGIVLGEGSLRVHRYPTGTNTGVSVSLTAADGARLRASLIESPGATRCVMVLHGIGDSRAGALGFAPKLRSEGYTVLAPDSRAHGESGGDLVTYGVLEQDDVRRWAAWLRTEHGCSHVYGLGESLGGSVLIMAASGDTPTFDAIVAECPYTTLKRIGAYRVGQLVGGPEWWQALAAAPLIESAALYTRLRYGIDLRLADPVKAASQLRVPLLLIHGLDDRRTPVENSRLLEAAAPRGLVRQWEVPGARHTDASRVDGARFWAEVLAAFAGTRPELGGG